MKLKLALLLLALGSLFAQVSVGIRIGPPPPSRVVAVVPPSPGPDYIWIEGYWYVDGHKYKWHDGYWTRPPYPGAHWIAPRHDGERFFAGYWDGERGRRSTTIVGITTITAITTANDFSEGIGRGGVRHPHRRTCSTEVK